MTRTVVVGGGIAGLAGAWELAKAGHDVVVLEASDRLGGKIRTTPFAGRPVDEGADAFLARVPAGAQLAKEVGLGDDLVSPATGHASLWVGGRLRPIPGGHVLGVPVDLRAVARAGVLSPLGLARAAVEPYLPGRPLADGEDVAVGRLVARRFGREVQERLVDPLLGGINAGRSEELSIDVGAAQLAAAARADRSLGRGLRALRAANPPDPSAPVFYAPAGGMQRLVDGLATNLAAAGVELRTGEAVTDLASLGADRVLVAVPAHEAAGLVAPLSERAAAVLGDVGYAGVVLVTIAYRRADLAAPLTGSGFLVPRREGRFITAASVFSNKWPALDDPDLVIVRASAGRFGDDRPLAMDDAAVVDRVHAEVAEALGIRGLPQHVRVSRWPRSFPQFRPGHRRRMADVHAMLAADAPGVAVAGAYVDGVGIPTVIGSAQAAAARLTAAR
jgi:oxygen-dependent protoporphyrinogen oxidase